VTELEAGKDREEDGQQGRISDRNWEHFAILPTPETASLARSTLVAFAHENLNLLRRRSENVKYSPTRRDRQRR
jgi:hypothetical protein